MLKHGTALFLTAVVLLSTAAAATAEPGRWEQELSGEGWRLWLDHGAVWWDDDVYMPPVDVASLPVNPPTIGWEALRNTHDKIVEVPSTVEAHYWGEIGGAIPDVGGDYVGVSWWSTEFEVPPTQEGKTFILRFEQANLRAEVFVNNVLVGYDVIGNTPFEADATNAVRVGTNRLDVRITDPVGNFSWNDNILMRWGENLVPAVHGFGGITGKVFLHAVDDVRVADIYVQNKPNPRNIETFVTFSNDSVTTVRGTMTLTLHEYGEPGAVVWERSQEVEIPRDGATIPLESSVPEAKLWELAPHRAYKQANLYEATVTFTSAEGTMRDTASQRFGFRWFDVETKNGDKRFYLNGKRVVIIAAMTRGFWPTNGIFATPEMAERDMDAMIDMGYNMMLLHRAIGQPPVMEYADKMGLMTYEEPGGYRVAPNPEDDIEGPDQTALVWRREKLKRMVIRDRSLPSMMIYNLKNEARNPPDDDDIYNVRMVHSLDPSRIITYNSDRNRDIPYDERIDPDPFKLHMLPYDNTLYYRGWWDQHHWFSWAGYVDDNYENPNYYLRGVVDAPREPAREDSLNRLDESEIIFWGEEGAFGTMVRLQKIKERLEITGATGFREQEHLDWFEAYDEFLDNTGFRSAYPTVDDLTMSMGRRMHYFHGRNIENIRMSNIADGVNVNGWGSASTRTDIVDMYRNPTADPSILAHYTRPLYVAVKIRDKVLPKGAEPVVDFYIINEKNLAGDFRLRYELIAPDGSRAALDSTDVSVTGGETYGELLAEGITLPVLAQNGHYRLNASITDTGIVRTTGFDTMFVVDLEPVGRMPGNIAVLEDGSAVADFIEKTRNIQVAEFTPGVRPACIIVGAHEFNDGDGATYNAVLREAVNGAKVIVLDNADRWGELLNGISRSRPATYQGGGIHRWANRGRHFVGYSPYLEKLPQAQEMNWEYQTFYQTDNVAGIDLHYFGTDLIVALGAQHTKEILSSLARIPVGDGEVFLSTLEMIPRLDSIQPQSTVAKRLLLNLIEVN